MILFARFAAIVIALLHFGFMYLEMVLWTQPMGQDIFSTTESFAQESAALAFNQGLYNGFLAAGLVWGALTQKRDVVIFFLLCVLCAGVVGALTASPRILLIQAMPAALALLVAFASGRWR